MIEDCSENSESTTQHRHRDVSFSRSFCPAAPLRPDHPALRRNSILTEFNRWNRDGRRRRECDFPLALATYKRHAFSGDEVHMVERDAGCAEWTMGPIAKRESLADSTYFPVPQSLTAVVT